MTKNKLYLSCLQLLKRRGCDVLPLRRVVFVSLLASSLSHIQAHATGVSSASNAAAIQNLSNREVLMSLSRYRAEAQSRQMNFLPQFIDEKIAQCENVQKFPGGENCLKDLHARVRKTMSCPTSQRRFNETVVSDWQIARKTFLDKRALQAPSARLQARFDRLAKVAAAYLDPRLDIRLRVATYQSENKNAHALVDGTVILSEALWKAEPIHNDEEVDAVIAHELGHVIKMHGMRLSCLYLEWVGADMTISEAHSVFLEDFTGSIRAADFTRVSHKAETEADDAAVWILNKAGLNPFAMVTALKKLVPQSSGVSLISSHPAFDQRIKRAEQEAGRVSQKK